MAKKVTPSGKLLTFTPTRAPLKQSALVDELVANNAQLTATLGRLFYVLEAVLTDLAGLDAKKLQSDMSSALATSERLMKRVEERGYSTARVRSAGAPKGSAVVY